MSMERRGVNKKWLVAILVVLVTAIVGLVVGIVVVNVSKKGDATEVAVEDVCSDLEVTEGVLLEGETMKDAEKRLCQDKQWDNIMENLNSEVARLLDSDPVDVDAINRLYDDSIEKANEWGRHDYVVELINSRTRSLLSRELENEALSALLAVDVNILDNVEKYFFYTEIIEIAEQLGDQGLVAKYTSERKEIEADFLAQSEETRQFAESVGADSRSYVGKEKE